MRNGFHVGVRLPDTAARGTDLMADSRPVIDQDVTDFGVSLKAEPPYYFVSCDTDAMISIDGSAIVCVYATTTDDDITTMGFARISTRTGNMNHVNGLVRFKGQTPPASPCTGSTRRATSRSGPATRPAEAAWA